MFGFLNVYKPRGMTSHDVVAVLRRLTNIKQIGHTGTLDPFAEGVLPVCIGKATRLIEFLADDKEYLATIQFGASTTTCDIEGEINFTSDKKIREDEVVNALKFFEGEIEQFPPIYSAVKVNGKKLYEYARKGVDVEIKPRKVIIKKIELKSFDNNLQQAQILIECSKGTYIRSVADDLGKKLGCGAYLIKLIRTRAGKFNITDSLSLDGIDVEKNLINPVTVLDLCKAEVKEEDIKRIKNGLPIKNNGHAGYVILIYNNDVCAVGMAQGDNIKLKKVFL